jgi:hypothetical protein
MRCPIETGEGQLLLDSARSAALADHIRDCPACGAFHAARQSVDFTLDLWDPPPVSADFDRRLYSRIGQEVPWWEFLVHPFRPVFAARVVPVAAAAALLFAAGLWIERPGALPPPPAPRTAGVEALPPEQAEHALQDMEMMQEFSRLVRTDRPDEPGM